MTVVWKERVIEVNTKVEFRKLPNRLRYNILELAKSASWIAFWVLMVSLAITVPLISQIRIYAKLAGMSTAMLDYQNEKFHLYNHKAFELPDEMKDLIEIENWVTDSFYDFGAEVFMKEYNSHMKVLLSHHPKFRKNREK